MDELVIEDKKYLSSKKAAKLTGYAKDYVGQLCREGKVSARLVGRNWYVLEESIMDHRFGPGEPEVLTESQNSTEDLEPAVTSVPEAVKSLEYSWEVPVYTAEPYSSLPESVESSVVKTPSPETPLNSLTDMQSAWQEWFAKQKTQEKTLPDGSDMLLPEASEKELEPEEDLASQPPASVEDREEYQIPIQRAYTKDSEPEEKIHISTEYVQKQEPEERVQPIQIQWNAPTQAREAVRVQRAQKYPPEASNKAYSTREPKKSPILVKVSLLALAGIFVAITYLSVVSTETAEYGRGNSFINFITGVSTVKSIK